MEKKITYIDEVNLTNLRILIRADFNISLASDGQINEDVKIRQTLPTIKYLLEKNNKLILISHLGKPKDRESKFSLQVVANRLQELLPDNKIILVNDFLTADPQIFSEQTNKEIILLENIRYYPEEKKPDPTFTKKLAHLGESFVNDGFGVCHRFDTSVVGITQLLPSYGGLLLKKEVESIGRVTNHPQKPVVAIIGGAKISTKIGVIEKLLTIADTVLIGGAMANNFFKAQGWETGKSLVEPEFIEIAKKLLGQALQPNIKIILPIDVRIGKMEDVKTPPVIKKATAIAPEEIILDIGPETEKLNAEIIAQAKTIIWNGPVGFFENPKYSQGTQAIYQAIINNQQATSIIGGGDTLTAIKNYGDQDKITHISTGGGAMLELVEKGTLPGLEALSSKS